MTTQESTTRVVTQVATDAGPGERLREAREAAGLTLGEVASRLRLEPRAVERLENDDYESLHGPTFVRGYLGSYARLLDLPAQPILEAYERHGYGPPALVSELGGKSEVHVGDFPVRMVTYVIAGLLVVLVVLWWQSRQLEQPAAPLAGAETDVPAAPAATTAGDEDRSGERSMPLPSTSPSEPGEPGEPGEAAAAAPPPTIADTELPAIVDEAPPPSATTGGESTQTQTRAPQPLEPSASGSANAEIQQPARHAPATSGDTTSETTGETTGETTIASLEAPLEAAPDGASTEPGGSDPVDAGSDAGSDSGAELSDGGAAAEPAAAPRPQPLPGSDVLAIQLSRESWIEIYDRGGGRLYYSLAQEGSEIVVTGAGPMRVLLGEADGAEVAYNGKPFDLSGFRGRSVVRFTVGESDEPSTPEAPSTRAAPRAAPRAAEEPLTGDGRPAASAADAEAVADAGRSLDSTAASESGAAPASERTPVSDTNDAADALPRATRPDT